MKVQPSRGKLWALRALTGLLVAAALVLALAVWITRAARQTRELEARASQAAALTAEAQDLLDRHPDFDFASQALRLEACRRLSPRELARQLPAIQALYAELLTEAVSRATGVSPGAAGWGELEGWKTFSPNGVLRFIETRAFARTRPPGEPPPITGEPAADARIARLAVARGYRLRPLAEEEALVSAGGQRLQGPASEALRRMREQAASEGVSLEAVSGYRSVERQRAIFLGALRAEGLLRAGRPYTPSQIASGVADEAVEAVLRESAPPGYSRHHTGYAVDLNDPSASGDFTKFASSPGFAWLARANFLNAKRFGFLPSYPAGASGQGPEPEPWEYLWVGKEALAAPAAQAVLLDSHRRGATLTEP